MSGDRIRPGIAFASLGALSLLAFIANASLGSVSISLAELWRILWGAPDADPVLANIIWEFRLPRAVTGALAGAALAVSGLMMQTIFRNPLADPFVLGVNSGASLGVALVLLALAPMGVSLHEELGLGGQTILVLAATVGAGATLGVLLGFARRVDVMSLLILGLMISYGVGAIVSLLMFFSMADRLQAFFFWSYGNFGTMTWDQLRVFVPLSWIGVLGTLTLIKPLDAFLLGERYAQSLGVDVKRYRFAILACASLLAGLVTGYCGPIGFLGIAAPHFCRFLFKTAEHRLLLPACILAGATLALLADLAAKAPGIETSFPLNAIMALIGAPVIIVALLKQRNLRKAFGA